MENKPHFDRILAKNVTSAKTDFWLRLIEGKPLHHDVDEAGLAQSSTSHLLATILVRSVTQNWLKFIFIYVIPHPEHDHFVLGRAEHKFSVVIIIIIEFWKEDVEVTWSSQLNFQKEDTTEDNEF